jgi:hypothetical protein
MRLSRTATGLVRYLGLQGRTIYLRGVFASTLRSLPSMSKDERITRLDIVISDLFSRLFTLSYSLDCRILPQTVDIVARLRPWIDKYRYWSDRQRHFLHSISTLLTGGILILLQVKRRQLGGVEIGIKGLGDKGKVLTSFGSILTLILENLSIGKELTSEVSVSLHFHRRYQYLLERCGRRVEDMNELRFILKQTVLRGGGKSAMEASSCMTGKKVKISSFFAITMYHVESRKVQTALRKQTTRLIELSRKIKNVRNLEDNLIKQLKMDLFRLKQKQKNKVKKSADKSSFFGQDASDEDDIICVGEEEEEMEIPQWKTDSANSKSILDKRNVDSKNSLFEPGVKDFLRKQTAIMEVDKYLKHIEKKESMGDINFGLRFPTQSVLSPRKGSEGIGASPAQKKHLGIWGHQASSDMVASKRDTSSKTNFSPLHKNAISRAVAMVNELNGSFVKIRVKKNLIFFYDLLDKSLSDLTQTSSSGDIDNIRVVKKLQEMRAILKNFNINRWYLAETLETECKLRYDLFKVIDQLKTKYKITQEVMISHKKQGTTRASKSIVLPLDSAINPVSHKEFCKHLSTVSDQRDSIHKVLGEMSSLIKEYLEVKESTYGFKIGDQKSVLAYFLQNYFDDEDKAPSPSANKRHLSSHSRVDERSFECSSMSESESLSEPPQEESSFNQGSFRMKPGQPGAVPKQWHHESEQNSVDGLSRTNRTIMSSPREDEYKGKELIKKYRKIKLLSDNIGSKVYLVEDRSTKLIYSMKVVKHMQPEIRRNVYRGLSSESPLENINDFVMRVFTEFKVRDQLLMICEYMEAGSLKNFIKTYRHNLGTQEIVKILANLLLCIEALQAAKYIHRRINPEHVLVNIKGQVKLNYLGISLQRKCEC